MTDDQAKTPKPGGPYPDDTTEEIDEPGENVEVEPDDA